MSKSIFCLTLAYAAILYGFTGCGTYPGTTRKYQNTTPVPAGIAAPDRLGTRFGTLHFFDGFPDPASAEKLYNNLDYQRAVQAYLLAMPAVSQMAWRKGVTNWGAPNSTVLIFEQLTDPRTLELSANYNNNAVYTMVALDLQKDPLVVEVPPKVIGAMNDMWMRWVGDVGIAGPDKGEGGKYLLLPPGYQGEVPDGYFVLRPETSNLSIIWCSPPVEGDPKSIVDQVKKDTKVYRLSEASNPPQPKFVNVSAPYVSTNFNTIAPADYSFWTNLNEVVQSEPTETIDPTTLGVWASVGIQKGKPFAPDARMKKILTEAAAVGDATARALAYRCRIRDAYFFTNSAWRTFNLGSYKFEDNGVPILDVAAGYYFYFLGVTPTMSTKSAGSGSQYAFAFHDARGKPMDGGKSYRLHLPPGIPAKDAWSVILYDNQTRSMLQTDQYRPAVNSQAKDLLLNADGSADIYFGPEAPPGKETNWIQTIPGKGWSVILRLDGPLKSWFDRTWRPGEIELVD